MEQVTDPVRAYLAEVSDLLTKLPLSTIDTVIKLLWQAYEGGKQVFVLGNGGSAATASHFACDLGKGTAQPGQARFRVLSLTDNVPLITAWANDSDYQHVFAEQLANLVQRDDVVIAISGSGNSPNVLNAVRLAREQGAITVGLCGFQGGQLAHLVHYALVVPSKTITQAEDVHLILVHLITDGLKRRLMTRGEKKA